MLSNQNLSFVFKVVVLKVDGLLLALLELELKHTDVLVVVLLTTDEVLLVGSD